MTFTKNSPSPTPERLLILGCGDLGQRLATELADKPYAITGIRRRPAAACGNLSFRALDLTQPQLLAQLLAESWDVVVITLTPDERSDQGYKRTYVDTAQTLVNALKANAQQPRLLLFVSSSSVYGQDDGSWVDESSSCQASGFNGQRLLEAEAIFAASGLNHCILRFSGIYGPGRERLIDLAKRGQAPLGNNYTNRIHARDCARVMAHLLERQKQAPLASLYIATDSAPCSQTEVALWLSQALGVTPPSPPAAAANPGGKRLSNRRLLDSGFQLSYPDFRLGYAELLKQPTSQDKT